MFFEFGPQVTDFEVKGHTLVKPISGAFEFLTVMRELSYSTLLFYRIIEIDYGSSSNLYIEEVCRQILQRQLLRNSKTEEIRNPFFCFFTVSH
jgi:hypothetical protein